MNAAPPELGEAGAKLWAAVHASLPEGYELDDKQRALLRLACDQADELALVAAAIQSHGAIVKGSQGQPVLNAALQEARQARAAIARLVKQLELPGDEPMSASEKARKAARARWSGHGPVGTAPWSVRELPKRERPQAV